MCISIAFISSSDIFCILLGLTLFTFLNFAPIIIESTMYRTRRSAMLSASTFTCMPFSFAFHDSFSSGIFHRNGLVSKYFKKTLCSSNKTSTIVQVSDIHSPLIYHAGVVEGPISTNQGGLLNVSTAIIWCGICAQCNKHSITFEKPQNF